MGPRQAEYAEGRRDGTFASETFGLDAADSMVEFLQTLDERSLYMVAFRRSVNDFATNQIL